MNKLTKEELQALINTLPPEATISQIASLRPNMKLTAFRNRAVYARTRYKLTLGRYLNKTTKLYNREDQLILLDDSRWMRGRRKS